MLYYLGADEKTVGSEWLLAKRPGHVKTCYGIMADRCDMMKGHDIKLAETIGVLSPFAFQFLSKPCCSGIGYRKQRPEPLLPVMNMYIYLAPQPQNISPINTNGC